MTLPQTDTYLEAVAAELADLDASDRDDLLEDLQLHLAELRAEDSEVDLVGRLGTPVAYAAELRQSAGLPAPAGGPSVAQRLAGLRDALLDKGSRRPWVRAVLEFLPQLRPAWWVLRAYGVVALVDWLLHQNGYSWVVGVVPQVHGEQAVGFLVLLGLVVGSVRLATRPPAWRRWRQVALVANTALAVATPAYFFNMQGDTYVESGYGVPCCGALYGDNGAVHTNLYGYDADGNLIPQLQLFDQDGNGVYTFADDLLGPQQTNVYPHQQLLPDGTYGIPTPPAFPGPQVVTPQFAPSPSTSPDSSPAPSASPAATAKASPVR